MDLQEVGWDMDWINLAQERNRGRYLWRRNEHSVSIKCG
jgi:hypothetical protein